MIESRESNYRTIILFLVISLAIILVYIGLFEMVQTIELASGGLVHRTLVLNALLLIVAVFGVLIVYGGFQVKDLGLIGRKLKLAVIICIITWVLIQAM
ncbi:MAG: hypothetical protein ACFFE1_17665, partial [Candidatus Thorarchaeota archaeon]